MREVLCAETLSTNSKMQQAMAPRRNEALGIRILVVNHCGSAKAAPMMHLSKLGVDWHTYNERLQVLPFGCNLTLRIDWEYSHENVESRLEAPDALVRWDEPSAAVES
jgi:hypothetical protein